MPIVDARRLDVVVLAELTAWGIPLRCRIVA
jgi:hypothetical protein